MTVTTALPTESLTGTWVIDPSHSEAGFTTRHAGIAKVRGSVAITEGTIVVGDDVTGSTVTAVLDPSTIDTRDANRDGIAEQRFALREGLNQPFGMQYVGGRLYVANTDAVISFPYQLGATSITAPPRTHFTLPAGGATIRMRMRYSR